MNKNRILERLKKVQALAERGVGGEKETAKKLLDNLISKYDISKNDIENESVTLEYFRFKTLSEERLLSQIIYMIMGTCDTYTQIGNTGRKHKVIGVYCTTSERLEIEINYEFFLSCMEKEIEKFYLAFINKNDLFPSENKVKHSKEDEHYLSKKDILDMAFIMNGIEQYSMKKMIENK